MYPLPVVCILSHMYINVLKIPCLIHYCSKNTLVKVFHTFDNYEFQENFPVYCVSLPSFLFYISLYIIIMFLC